MGTVNKTLTLGNTVSSTLNVNSVRGTNSGWSTPHYTFTLSVKLNSQSTTNNTSNVDITLSAVAKNDYWSGTAITYTVYKSDSDSYSTSSSSNYKSQSFSGFSYSEYNSGTSKTVVTWPNVTVNHNTDGSKILYVNASGPGNGGNSDAPNRFNFSTGGSSAAMKITLPTIARASTVSSPTTYSVTSTSSSSGLNITVEPKASYYHTIIWKIGSTTIKSDNRTSKTSSNFTATIYNSELLNKISSSSANVVAEVSTYSTYSNNVYSGQIGSTVITPAIGVTVDTSSVKPSITSITTGGKTTISGSSIYIAGVSKPVISWKGTNKIGAGTYSYTINITPSVSGLTPLTATRSNLTSGSSHTFTNTLPTYSSNYNATVSLTVTDSRGGFDTLETTISIYGYQQPNISQFDAYRVVDSTHDTRDPAGTVVRVKYTVSYSTITVSNANKNTLSVICNKNGSQLSNTSTYNSTFALNADASCTITLAVNDSITTLPTRTIIISQAAYPLDLYDNSSGSVGVGLGTLATSGHISLGLPVNTDIYFDGGSGSERKIYWKEGAWGDQFAIIPYFNSSGDNNKLIIQSAVGENNTSPALVDRVTIAGSSGNVNLLTGSLSIASGNLTVAGSSTFTGAINSNGAINLVGDLNLNTSGTSSNDSADIVWHYGDSSEKMRIWTGNEYTDIRGPNFRIYNTSGTSLFSGRLAVAAYRQATNAASSTATSATAGTYTQITFSNIESNNISTDTSGVFKALNNSIQVLKAGKYRISGSVYMGTGTDTSSTKGRAAAHIFKRSNGGSFSSNSSYEQIGNALYGNGTDVVVTIPPKIHTLAANDVIYLAARAIGVAGNIYMGNKSTYLLIELVSN